MANEAFHEKMSLENHIGKIYNTWLLKVDGHHLKSGIPHDQRVIVWGIDSWSFGVCSHNVLISQRQNIYREKGKPSVVHPLSSSSSTVFLVECRFLRRGQNRSTGKKSSRSKGENQQELNSARPQRKRNKMEIFRFMGWTLRLCCVEVVHFPMHPISFYLVILKSACVSHCACVSGLWSWDTPVLYPYSDKKLCSSPPSVDFFASDMPTRKNKHWTRGQKQKFFNLTPHSAWSCSSLNITNTHLKNLVAKNFH